MESIQRYLKAGFDLVAREVAGSHREWGVRKIKEGGRRQWKGKQIV